MLSLHFTGSLWYLLLLPPGLYLLWRQYRGWDGAGASRLGGTAPRILAALQGLALIVLVASLPGPELRRHEVEYHNPAVLLLRDRSGSFRGGAYLGLGAACRRWEEALAAAFRARKYDVLVADFHESAWPTKGFPRAARRDPPPEQGAPLTDLGALADFVDSAGIPNLQAAVLFSDGRGNDSGKAARTWKVPVFPLVLSPDSISEVQPERVSIQEKSGGKTPGGQWEVEVAWRPVGRPGGEPVLRLLRGDKTVLTRSLPATGPVPASGTVVGARQGAGGGNAGMLFRFPWEGGRPGGTPARSGTGQADAAAQEKLRAVLQPGGGAAANFNPFNDTVPVASSSGPDVRRIHVLRPVHSLDEKAMLDILYAWGEARVATVAAEDLRRMAFTPKDQIWVDAGALGSGSLSRGAAASASLAAALGETPAKVVVYARGPVAELAGRRLRWETLPLAAEVRAGRSAAEVFPDDVVRLKAVSARPVEAPAAGDPWQEEVSAGEGGRRGVIMGRFALPGGKPAFFFVLPSLWTLLFDPQADFATRENTAGYVRAAALLAETEAGSVRVSHPAAYHLVPFELEARLSIPGPAGAAGPGMPSALRLAVSAPGFAKQYPMTGKHGEFRLENLALPAGRYRLELRAEKAGGGGDPIWRDSLEVAPKEALELARIGFDWTALGELASRSGGRLLVPGGDPGDSAAVAAMLPQLPAAQIRMEKVQSFRLYNTRVQFLLVAALLALSWTFRKRWNFD